LKRVINHEVRSANLWDGNPYHHCPVDPCRWDRYVVPKRR